MNRKATEFIVLHCSATRAVQNIRMKDIKKWHTDPVKYVTRNKKKVNVGGRGWSDIGYHFVIGRDGKLENGRALMSVGSHVAGHNGNSIGVCLVGGLNNDTYEPEDNFTKEQWATLKTLVAQMLVKFPNAKILGHRDFGVPKACPCFDARAWARKNKFPV